MKASAVHETLSKHMLATGEDIVIDLERSHGSYIYDSLENREYIDFFTYFASIPIGHNHPKMKDPVFQKKLLTSAMSKPSSSDFYTTLMAEFVDTFARVAMPKSMPYLFLVSGGALAVENALKTAFDWKFRKNVAKIQNTPDIAQHYALEGMGITEEVLKEVVQTEAIAIAQIEAALKKYPGDIAGLIIEPIQGEGGDNHFRPEFFQELRRLADEHDLGR